MMFNERIKQLRKVRQMPQRQLVEALDINTAAYCKIEGSERFVQLNNVAITKICLLMENKDLKKK